MAYTVRKTDGTTITVNDASINTDTNLQLIGKNFPGYGEAIAENFVRMLENFSDESAPGSAGSESGGTPLEGQLWYKNDTGTLSVYDGASWVGLLKQGDDLSGNATTASRLETARQITIDGEASGSTMFDGSQNVTITVANNELNGQPASYYLDASNINAGTISDTYLPATISSNITGSAATASSAATLTTPRSISLGGDVTGSASFDGSSNITITTTVANDSHNHTIANIDGLQAALDGKLDDGAQASDANSLDGLNSTQFLRSDVDDTMNANLTVTGSITAASYDTSSDVELKDGVEVLNISKESIKKIKLKSWKWKDTNEVAPYLVGKEDSGIVAQDLLDIPELKHCVSRDEVTGKLKVNHGKLAVHLILSMIED